MTDIIDIDKKDNEFAKSIIPSNSNNEFEDLYSIENRKKLTRMVLNLFEKWGLKTDEKLSLLGYSPKRRHMLTKLQNGSPIGLSIDLIDRVSYLMSIHKSLGLLFPHETNSDLKYSWVSLKNADFQNETPLEVMISKHLIGIAQVDSYLNFMKGR